MVVCFINITGVYIEGRVVKMFFMVRKTDNLTPTSTDLKFIYFDQVENSNA